MKTIIEKYHNLLKQIAHDVTDQGHPGKESQATDHQSHQVDVLYHALYVLEIGELAKKNFIKHGLPGPARHPDVGGRYLRLYGVLSAVFQQKQALENLLTFYQIEEKDKISNSLNNSAILNLCSKLGVHATYFRRSLTEPEEPAGVYEISRPDLEVNKIKLLINKLECENFDVQEDLDCFDKKMELTLSFLIGRILKKPCKNQSHFYEQYTRINKLKNHALEVSNPGANS
ncbi:hypothetical protein ACD591_05145 [Rufibacter glacialis]|uniref:Uncharacterized protein n=1 Tax=Rufibacter glacialis TaxID=1259555 RepID=A0A5M8QFC1_9BACT|nr:hypothetical protein [Rufibacter glacialis]KAA6434735.1 hypothetical protein FOE74_11205 [Rufibacter glacialis]GGK72002.1 hypothetical protein GCM10011405_20280 [Rufibacter glacialis]